VGQDQKQETRIQEEPAMIDIKVLGTGCAACLKTQELVVEVLQSLGIRDANVELVTEQRMIDYGLKAEKAPGLMINGNLAWAGSVPPKEQLGEWIRQAAGVIAA
jgi:hypothetical protein